MLRRMERGGLPPESDTEASGEAHPPGMGDLRSTANSGLPPRLPPKSLPALTGEDFSGVSLPTLGAVELMLDALVRSGET